LHGRRKGREAGVTQRGLDRFRAPSHSAITAPPPPAPVSLAPSAPASRAIAQARSISGVDRKSPDNSIWL
jgi:hypothetical protein